MRIRIGLFCLVSAPLILATQVAAQLVPDCPGRWVSSGGGGDNCVCPNGVEADAYESGGQLKFKCPTPPPINDRFQARPAPSSPKRPTGPSYRDIAAASEKKANAQKQLATAKKKEKRLRAKLKDAERALNSAETILEHFEKKSRELQEKADATNDPQKKLSLLKRRLKLVTSMKDVVRQRDKLKKMISSLQGQHRRADYKTAVATKRVSEASQAQQRLHGSQQDIPYPTARQKTPVQADLESKVLKSYKHKTTIQTIADHADYATLASAAYEPNKKNVSGWTRLYTMDYENERTGSNAATVYKSAATGKLVVAFQGTNEKLDVITGFKLFGKRDTGQVDWAKNTARAFVEKHGHNNVTFVGHSLGGRLARIARTETGANAVVFDSAPLSIKEMGGEIALTLGAKAHGTLTSFRGPGDVVSFASVKQDIEIKNFIPYAKSQSAQSLPMNIAELIAKKEHAHSIDSFAEAMQTVKGVNTLMKQY